MVKKAGSPWREQASSFSHIRQGYMACDGATVRVRTRDEKAYLTIKGPSYDGGLARYEFEKEITPDEATELLKLCRGGVIDKVRYLVPCGNHVYEVDEFYGDNEGLVFAEVELHDEHETYDKPDFLGPEVTGNKHYYNKHMLGCPYSLWCDKVPEDYR